MLLTEEENRSYFWDVHRRHGTGTLGSEVLNEALPLNRNSSATVMAAAASGALERIAATGVDPEDVLSEVGLRSSDFTDPTNRISLASYCSFFEVAARKTTRSSFGLEFGASFQPQQLGMLGYLAVSSPTLGVALRKFAAYLPTHQQATRLAVIDDSDSVSYLEYAILDGEIRHRQQDADCPLRCSSTSSPLPRPGWVPSAIHLMHAKTGGKDLLPGCLRHDAEVRADIESYRFQPPRAGLVPCRAATIISCA